MKLLSLLFLLSLSPITSNAELIQFNSDKMLGVDTIHSIKIAGHYLLAISADEKLKLSKEEQKELIDSRALTFCQSLKNKDYIDVASYQTISSYYATQAFIFENSQLVLVGSANIVEANEITEEVGVLFKRTETKIRKKLISQSLYLDTVSCAIAN